jgi:epoxide hydrolase-like predicted phosphatase
MDTPSDGTPSDDTRKDDMRKIRAVIFDLGGVVMDSPLHAIARYERDHGIEHNAINHSIVAIGESGAWSRLERGELTLDEFFGPFEQDCREHGMTVDARHMMEYIAEAGVARPQMLEAVRCIRAQGLGVAALTNNWTSDGESPVRSLFPVFIESSVVGWRKPDPRIYELACGELGITPAQAVFLDDIGRNLKSARALGMTTIKVDDPDEALAELTQVLGFPLST